MKTRKLGSIEELRARQLELELLRQKNQPVVSVCAGTGCLACGCTEVAEAMRLALDQAGLSREVELKTTGCHGPCERGPLVLIQPEGIFYQKVKPADAPLIVDQTLVHGRVVERLLYRDPDPGKRIERDKDIPFFNKQMRLLSGNNAMIDPTAINDYLALDGYQALSTVLSTMTSEGVIDLINTSQLRGRGGGGFPTGRKWASCRRAEGDVKYVICNADEGDPGAFMDRSLLEGNPHMVIEGMMIGAFAIGSTEGYVYVRNEYPLAFRNLTVAIEQARQLGLLGKEILGTKFDFDLEVSRGGGAFVCGESTALMASLEGKVGEPRAKYIHTVDQGLWNRPSCLNNVETWANVPLIVNMGADKYAAIGTEGSKGTKLFALSGKVRNTGLVEVPMGITLRDILYDIGGGVSGGKEFKAVQTGGPSGGTLIVEKGEGGAEFSLLDLPVDFDELTRAGSMMGSGGMIVMDKESCMVDVARYFLAFLQEESCGKCLPCREGLRTMLNILDGVCEGRGSQADLETLEELSEVMIDTCLCQLGGAAPNPVLSTLRYFHAEYLAHIEDGCCPAGVCKELVSHAIGGQCNGCHICATVCPVECIVGEPKGLHSIGQNTCVQCGACFQACPTDAIERVKRGEGHPVQIQAGIEWQVRQKKSQTVQA